MSRTRIKICGLTQAADAICAVDAGADALGVILYADSPRTIDLERAVEVLGDTPPLVARIGVFVDAPEDFVAEAVERIGLTAVQFHGDESPARCAGAPLPVIRVMRVGPGFSVSDIEPYIGAVAAVLLDTYSPEARGGTGSTFPWRQLDEISIEVPVILAGGLSAANVAEAIETVRPFAVDVASGVESSRGIKDHVAIRAFGAAVRAADAKRVDG
ncbi:MAG: phosphoribosylanthranilate isomerase [Coriobacteriia bacterium]|nr:phosphoribosylanthranilate isomerase [Coriobacteriia bacterium]